MITGEPGGPAPALAYGIALLAGASLGSFLNCAAWRIARGKGFVRGRSRCPSCGRVLRAPELIPIISWVALRGRCRGCKGAISLRYPLCEALFALLTLLAIIRSSTVLLFVRNLAFLACLFCLSLVDLETGRIPGGCLAGAALAWALTSPFTMSWSEAALRLGAGLFYAAALLGLSLAMDRLFRRESLGGGDIRLFAVVGLYLGWAGTLFALLGSCVLGIAFAALLRRRADEPFPFGPAIAAASAWVLLYGQRLTAWYLSLAGII